MTEPAAPWPEGGLERVEACPICGSADGRPLHEGLADRVFRCAPGRWSYRVCSQCGAAYLDPRPTLETLPLAYAAYYTRPAGQGGGRISRGTRRLAAEIDSQLRALAGGSRGRLLDVGCGDGGLAAELAGRGWNAEGMDPDPGAGALAASRGVAVRHGRLAELAYPEGRFDALVLSHAVEHAHDSVGLLRECRRLLRAGGLLWIATPNLGGQGHRRWGADWIGLDVPRHILLFTPESLLRAVAAAGFEVVEGPLPGRSARWYFAASMALRHGLDPLRTSALPPLLRWRARAEGAAAAIRSWRKPGTGEELILVVRKPLEQDPTASEQPASPLPR